MRFGMVATIRPYVDHLAPIYLALGEHERGGFYTKYDLAPYARERGLTDLGRAGAEEAWMVASFRDLGGLALRRRPGAPTVFMEHGVGLQWYSRQHLVRHAATTLICAPNEYWAERYRATVRTPVEVIGTPKMDALLRLPRESDGRTVAFSFHWTGIRRASTPPPARFRDAIAKLAARKDVTVLGHGHPAAWRYLERFWSGLGVEPVPMFEDVVRRADVYACDVSSTIYEFAALDRPVVLLEHPDGPRSFHRPPSGLRYEDFADVGRQARPQDLVVAIERALDGDEEHVQPRRAASVALYPYAGRATARAVEVLRDLPPALEIEQEFLLPSSDMWYVANLTDRFIERSGMVFEPGQTVVVPLYGSGLRQVTSCRYLSAWQ